MPEWWLGEKPANIPIVMPTKVGTHDKFQGAGICCWLPMRSKEVICCALPWIPAFAGMTGVERLCWLGAVPEWWLGEKPAIIPIVMPTKVGTHDKFQRAGICCWLPMRSKDVFCCALPWIPAFAGMTVGESLCWLGAVPG